MKNKNNIPYIKLFWTVIVILISFLFIQVVILISVVRAEDINNVKVVDVYDGDTIYVDLECKYDVLCKRIPIRLSHIDTPEMKTKNECEHIKAKIAKELVKHSIKYASVIDLKDVSRDKYFRIDADVYFDNVNLNNLLIRKHLAYSYEGKKKQKIDWCNF